MKTDPANGNPAAVSHLAPGEHFAPTGTLLDSWLSHWRREPKRPVLHDAERGWLNGADLERESAAAAARLAAAGLSPGERVLLSAESSAQLVVAYLACLRLGALVIPTNTAYGPDELAHIVSDARPAAALVDDAERAEFLRGRAGVALVCGPALDLDPGPAPHLDAAKPSTPALIGYTSGTTGRPKGAVLSHANLLASCEALRLAWRWGPRDRLVLCLPLFHMHGLGVGLHGTLHAGGSAVLLPGFDAEVVLDAVAAHDATLFFGVPTLYHRLVDSPRARELSRLRLCVSGSAPLPAELHRRFEEVSGQRVLERYGMTETAMLVSNPLEGERRPGCVGVPLPGVRVRLVGEPAEVQVRGPNVFDGYWERPDANAEAFTEDGWFRTGDLGEWDAAGYLRLVGRAKELIISGGLNVYPREVEDAVRGHPDVEDVAVVGEASEEWGERVVAYLVSRAPLSVAALRAWLGGRLAPFKHPRAVYRVRALPRNALGKVQKHRLVGPAVTSEG